MNVLANIMLAVNELGPSLATFHAGEHNIQFIGLGIIEPTRLAQ